MKNQKLHHAPTVGQKAGEPMESLDEETCEHGLSAWLCMGPNHYPTAEQEMRGEYF